MFKFKSIKRKQISESLCPYKKMRFILQQQISSFQRSTLRHYSTMEHFLEFPVLLFCTSSEQHRSHHALASYCLLQELPLYWIHRMSRHFRGVQMLSGTGQPGVTTVLNRTHTYHSNIWCNLPIFFIIAILNNFLYSVSINKSIITTACF